MCLGGTKGLESSSNECQLRIRLKTGAVLLCLSLSYRLNSSGSNCTRRRVLKAIQIIRRPLKVGPEWLKRNVMYATPQPFRRIGKETFHLLPSLWWHCIFTCRFIALPSTCEDEHYARAPRWIDAPPPSLVSSPFAAKKEVMCATECKKPVGWHYSYNL
jgi:hypothetical protein